MQQNSELWVMNHELNRLKSEAYNASVVVAMFALSFLVVVHLITPLQAKVLPVEYASMLFLPHGARILAVVFYGPGRGFLYLILASIFVDLTIGRGLPTTSETLAGPIIGAGCVPLAMYLLRFGFGDEVISLQHVNSRTWRVLFLLIIISSLFNSILQTVVVHAIDTTVTDVYLGLKFVLGDILGALVMLVVAQVLLKRLS